MESGANFARFAGGASRELYCACGELAPGAIIHQT